LGTSFTIIVAERELSTGKVTVRDMQKGEQHEVAIEDLASWLKVQRIGQRITGAD
jgi:histidyl-tRNA synthetase